MSHIQTTNETLFLFQNDSRTAHIISLKFYDFLQAFKPLIDVNKKFINLS